MATNGRSAANNHNKYFIHNGFFSASSSARGGPFSSLPPFEAYRWVPASTSGSKDSKGSSRALGVQDAVARHCGALLRGKEPREILTEICGRSQNKISFAPESSCMYSEYLACEVVDFRDGSADSEATLLTVAVHADTRVIFTIRFRQKSLPLSDLSPAAVPFNDDPRTHDLSTLPHLHPPHVSSSFFPSSLNTTQLEQHNWN